MPLHIGDRVRVAAYQAPLLPAGSMAALDLIRARIDWCEADGVGILCCPEAVLGGLADYATPPADFAIHARDLEGAVAPLASKTVTTIVGFTEIDDEGRLFNAAAVLHRGSVAGVYRKHHPAINRSVYDAGGEAAVFTAGGLTFGILICNDTNFDEPADCMAARGARAFFIPTNNGLPLHRADLTAAAMTVDIARVARHHVPVIRADVAGQADGRVSYGCSWIIDGGGEVRVSAPRSCEGLIAADLTF